MCEFCHKHGEGRKWYLEAKNYSNDLLADTNRQKFIKEFFSPDNPVSQMRGRLAKLQKMPALIRSVISRLVTRRMKKNHFGQVVPIEEVEQIFNFVSSITRVACICRKHTLGEEKRYCYGITLDRRGLTMGKIVAESDPTYAAGVNGGSFERLTKEEALAAFREHEKEGCCHTVWTFGTPFIGGICNCDRSDCLAMQSTVTHSLRTMFRGEWIAHIDPVACTGCRACMRVCQFGALTYSAGTKKTAVDPLRCYGCGICRSVCTKDAIHLDERTAVPEAARLW